METTIVYHEMKQRSMAWTEIRLGKIGGSSLKSIIDISKKGKLKSMDTVLTSVADVISEIETGFTNDSDYISDAMEWGIEEEENAKELLMNDNTFECGFVENSRFKYFGISPDMLETENGVMSIGYEIKCPGSKKYAKYVIENKLPTDHKVQVLGYFVAIPTLQKMKFVVYDPRFKTKKMHIVEVLRSDYKEFIENIEQSLIEFEKLVDEYLPKFR